MDQVAMDRLLTASEGRVRRGWADMVRHLRDENTEASIATRLEVGHYEHVAGVPAAAARYAGVVHGVFVAAGQAAAKWLAAQYRAAIRKKLAVFDGADPVAVRWAEQNRLDLIREIDLETRSMIRAALMEGASSGANPRQIAREIRESIGLTEYQRGIVENYRAALEGGQYSRALQYELADGRFDRALQTAIRDGKVIPPERVDAMVERYRANAVAARAETIARTEALRVAHQGTEELYRQAIASGDLRADQLERTWVHTPGRKERPGHRAMSGMTISFGESFLTPSGVELRYPGDPDAPADETVNCRCVVTTRMVAPAGAAADSGGPGMPAGDDVEVADEADMAAEADAADEAELADEDAAAATEGDVADEVDGADVAEADLADEAGDEAPDSWLGPSPPPPGWQHQQLQQSAQRVAARRAELQTAQAAHEAAVAEHAELEAGFRIGVNSEIAGETEADTVDWLREQQAAMDRARLDAEQAATAAVPIDVDAPSVAGDPYRTPAQGPEVVPSDAPAPIGYESFDFEGETFFRRATGDGPYYNADQLAEHNAGNPVTLTGPNDHVPGFDTIEVHQKDIKYRSLESGQVYTREAIDSGEAAKTEAWLKTYEEQAAKKPGLFRRVSHFLGFGRG